jgi:uncharacterized membrane protein
MQPILFVLMLIMIAASAIVYAASGFEQQGQAWAHQVCGLYGVCEHVYWLFVATLFVIALYLMSGRTQV